jgi:hypothetical protein
MRQTLSTIQNFGLNFYDILFNSILTNMETIYRILIFNRVKLKLHYKNNKYTGCQNVVKNLFYIFNLFEVNSISYQ